jgi:hypothetical protein
MNIATKLSSGKILNQYGYTIKALLTFGFRVCP